jgi:hypothetical protein
MPKYADGFDNGCVDVCLDDCIELFQSKCANGVGCCANHVADGYADGSANAFFVGFDDVAYANCYGTVVIDNNASYTNKGGIEGSQAQERNGGNLCTSAHCTVTRPYTCVDAVVEPCVFVDGYTNMHTDSYVDDYDTGCGVG